jgi:hypothetical protein
MREKRPPDVWVETAGGQPAEDLLLRHYRDGSVVALDLSAKPRAALRLLRRGGGTVLFELPARGVFVREYAGDGHIRSPVVASVGRHGGRPSKMPEDTRFAVKLDKANTLRLAFGTNGVARLKVGQPLDGLRLAVRCFPEAVALTLDGKAISADQPCASLVQGFNGLCRQTAPFRLEAGEHEVALETGAKDSIYYLPVAWLSGAFAVEDRVMKAVPQSVGIGALWRQGLADFAGRVTYAAEVEVPAQPGAVRLRLDPGGLYTSVALDGQALGERAWAPFEWPVPEALKGRKVILSVAVFTSVAPLFGGCEVPGAAWSKTFWVPPPNPRPEIGLVAAPEWVLE